ncbi:MAG TPA: fatty-acid oxidation protein subunit alpha [Bacteroidetes bacterium]|nr:fatty-acid oxidation protein subunit alpha [Bacteroidota bacterium]
MAKDIYHQTVKDALVSDGWRIVKDPYRLEIDPTLIYDIDLAAERLIVAEKGIEQIIVEIKSFINQSVAYDFHAALGQYLVYKTGLEEIGENSSLFLAVPVDTFDTFFQKIFIQKVLEKYGIKIISFDPLNKIISSWKK